MAQCLPGSLAKLQGALEQEGRSSKNEDSITPRLTFVSSIHMFLFSPSFANVCLQSLVQIPVHTVKVQELKADWTPGASIPSPEWGE